MGILPEIERYVLTSSREENNRFTKRVCVARFIEHIRVAITHVRNDNVGLGDLVDDSGENVFREDLLIYTFAVYAPAASQPAFIPSWYVSAKVLSNGMRTNTNGRGEPGVMATSVENTPRETTWQT